MTTLDIELGRVSKVYRENEDVTGRVIFESKTESKHEGITLSVEGIVNMQMSSKNVGLLDAFYGSVKPIQLINYTVDVAKSGRIPTGKTEVPFELPLKAKGRKTLFETYHGVFISIQYTVKCEVKRSMLTKDLVKVIEFIVESPNYESIEQQSITFNVSPDSLRNVKNKDKIPRFRVKGKLDSINCNIDSPFTGELIVESCEARIRSIELQLVRVETCGCTEGIAREATEVQNIQIAEGDVCRGLSIPIYMIFPRLFTSPTLITSNFKVEFEVNLVIIFENNHLITENFPIKLSRSIC
jgi:hypothetical protein